MTVEELRAHGVEWMNEAEIGQFLTSQRTGVLGLSGADPTEAPYLVPMSFGFDGASRLYFTYVLGSESRKRALSDREVHAGFLVYRVDTVFNWESVLLTGTVTRLPEERWNEVGDATPVGWRPDLFERASAVEAVEIYRFDVEERSGIRHTGLPPAFESPNP